MFMVINLEASQDTVSFATIFSTSCKREYILGETSQHRILLTTATHLNSFQSPWFQSQY